MSEQANVEIVREAYAAYGRGDIQGVLDRLADDVEWVVPGPKEIPYAGERRGKDQVAQFFKLVDETTELNPFEPREFIAEGDKVVVLGYYAGRAKASDRGLESHWAMAFTLRNGRITQFREYTDTANLAAAFGAPPESPPPKSLSKLVLAACPVLPVLGGAHAASAGGGLVCKATPLRRAGTIHQNHPPKFPTTTVFPPQIPAESSPRPGRIRDPARENARPTC